MSKVIVQVPMSKQLRDAAEIVAEEYGFSSIQEVMRVFMMKFANRSVSINIEETHPLSKQAEGKYLKMDQDFKNGKNVLRAKNVNQLMKQLHGNRLP